MPATARATAGGALHALLLAAAIATLAAAPPAAAAPAAAGASAAAAAPSTRAERVAAAKAFAQRTVSFDRERAAAQDDALLALAVRRARAQDCLAVWQAAPLARRADLGIVYFEYLSGALWSVDATIFRHWITDLRRSRRIDRSPVLARAADALRRGYVVASTIYTAVPDACATLSRWRDAGWTDAARPAVLVAVDKLVESTEEVGDDERIAAAGRQLVRYAPAAGRRAAAILSVGVDEPDALVESHTGCDAVGALVLPDAYEPCVP